jgi:hypothetical protein
VITQSRKPIRIAHPLFDALLSNAGTPQIHCGARSPRDAAELVTTDLAPPCKPWYSQNGKDREICDFQTKELTGIAPFNCPYSLERRSKPFV